MIYPIIDTHAHLWLNQNTIVDNQSIVGLENGRTHFMGEEKQMLPPFMLEGKNTAEMLLSNMDYAQVSAAVITQEFIDGPQDAYLLDVQKQYPNRFICCGLIDTREANYLEKAKKLIAQGFKGLKIPAQRLITSEGRVWLTNSELMELFKYMEEKNIFLSIDLADGNLQVAEMEEIIAECPNLKIAIGHFAMVTRPHWQDQVKLARHENVMIESGGITWLFHDEFYPFNGAIWAIKEAASLVGMNKLMWGSDYPRTIVAITYKMSYDFIVKTDLLTHEDKVAFLGATAQQFYGFKDLVKLPYIKNMSE